MLHARELPNPLRMLMPVLLLVLIFPLQAWAGFQAQLFADSHDRIKQLLDSEDSARLHGLNIQYRDDLVRLYRQREYRPIWYAAHGPRPLLISLVAYLRRAQAEGLAMAQFQQALEAYRQPPANALQLAQQELIFSDRFLRYIQQVGNGRFVPRQMDDEWFIYPDSFDRVAVLEQILELGMDMDRVLARMPPPHSGYRKLREQLARYRELAAWGGWPSLEAGETLKAGDWDLRVPVLRERLRISGDLHDDEDAGTSALFDEGLSGALLRFQERHGLQVDGRLGPNTRAALNVPVADRINQILINMERWRWLPRYAEGKYLLVNMAGFELEVYERHQAVMTMRVIIGKDYRQTPVFTSWLDSLVVNPYWYVPPTVLKKDLLPRLKRDPGHLHKMGMKLFSSLEGRGTEVDPASVDWQQIDFARFPYVIRQDPGPDNALGAYKFHMPNTYGIYFHDTPHQSLFQRRVRTFSSGCIRLEDPLGLAEYLLKGDARGQRQRLEAIQATGKTRYYKLDRQVPVYLVYWTAWVDQNGTLHFRNDIYDRDTRLLEAVREDEQSERLARYQN